MRTSGERAARVMALVVGGLVSALLLTGCIAAPVTASGSGVVTISWASQDQGGNPDSSGASQWNGERGNRLALCAETVSSCDPGSDPVVYFYDPAEGSMSAVLSTTSQVEPAGGGTATIAAGHYVLQAVAYTPDLRLIGDPLRIYIGPTGERDLTIWHQSVERPSADAACPRGYQPSWAQWPSGGAGGYVCDRQVYAYYPDEPVRAPGWDGSAPPWLLSVGRASADAPCPDGFDPSWAQWPDGGAGGYVCTQWSDA